MRKIQCLLGLLALLAAIGPAHATALAPGATVSPVPTGTLSYSSIVLTATDVGFKKNSGGINEAIVVDSTTGKLDFVYQVQVDPATPGNPALPVSQLRIQGYNNVGGPASGNNLDVFQMTTSTITDTHGNLVFKTGVTPFTSVSRDNGGGDKVSNNMSTAASLGNPSYIIVFRTNVTQFQTNEQAQITFNDGSTANTVKNIFAPKGVPEPTSLLIWSAMTGGLGLYGWRARRRQAKLSQKT